MHKYLVELCNEGNDDEYVTFKQWTTVDQAELITIRNNNNLNILISKLDSTAHCYFAQAHSHYLNIVKAELKSEDLVLGDLAENYKFVVQDEIQGFHWNTSSNNTLF